MSRRSISILASPYPYFALLVVSMFMLAGCGKTEPAAAPAKKKLPAVSVEQAKVEELSSYLDITGEAVAVDRMTISSFAEGAVSQFPWREGDVIACDSDTPCRVAYINRDLYIAEVHTAKAALSVATARLDDMKSGTRPEEIAKAEQSVKQLEGSARFAANDLERIRQLVASGSISSEAFEKAEVTLITENAKLETARQQLRMLIAGKTETEIAVQKALVDEAQAKLEYAEARLAECDVRAFFSGVVTKVFVHEGDVVTSKTPLLEVVNLETTVIRVAIPESGALLVEKGRKVEVKLDAIPGKSFSGHIVRLFPTLDSKMRTRIAEIEIEGEKLLLPGMFARLRIPLVTVKQARVISQNAVIATPTGATIVFVLVDGKAIRRPVKLGIESGGLVQVLTGLEKGEQVIVAGNEKLKDGVEVIVIGKGKGQEKPKTEGDAK